MILTNSIHFYMTNLIYIIILVIFPKLKLFCIIKFVIHQYDFS